jgi:hypothetical protein
MLGGRYRRDQVVEKPRAGSDWHDASFFLNLGRIDHNNRIPWATVEEAPVGSLAGAFFATDAQDGIDLYSPKRWVVFVGNPEHAILNRAIFDTGWGAGTARAAFGDNG